MINFGRREERKSPMRFNVKSNSGNNRLPISAVSGKSLHLCTPSHPAIAVFGDLPADSGILEPAAREFGWNVHRTPDIHALRSLSHSCGVVVVLFEYSSVTKPEDHLQTLRSAAGDARFIVCHRFSDSIAWSDWADAGAFDALLLPLKGNEVRRSLGFVWSAIRQSPPTVVSFPDRARRACTKIESGKNWTPTGGVVA